MRPTVLFFFFRTKSSIPSHFSTTNLNFLPSKHIIIFSPMKQIPVYVFTVIYKAILNCTEIHLVAPNMSPILKKNPYFNI